MLVIDVSRPAPDGGPVLSHPAPPVRPSPLALTRYFPPQFRIRAEGAGLTVEVTAAREASRPRP
ncbi:MAG: hypothetical protein M3Y59_02200 [Myxococcota bacterium]|nr:hypothetical protein [Myxococcota bacterium]